MCDAIRKYAGAHPQRTEWEGEVAANGDADACKAYRMINGEGFDWQKGKHKKARGKDEKQEVSLRD